MTIQKTRSGAALTIALKGRLDTVTAPELEKELQDSLDGVTTLVFDLENLEYVSSAGLRILLAAHKRMSLQGTMKTVHANDMIREIFDVTGFSEILHVE